MKLDNQEITLDMDGDGKVSKVEANIATNRFKNRRRMAWVSLLSMIICTAWVFSPYITEERIRVLDSVLGAFYLAMTSIVGAYMGFTAWVMNKDKS
jgi:hypothetical protein